MGLVASLCVVVVVVVVVERKVEESRGRMTGVAAVPCDSGTKERGGNSLTSRGKA